MAWLKLEPSPAVTELRDRVSAKKKKKKEKMEGKRDRRVNAGSEREGGKE